jgi:hypothetical protein
MSSTSTPAKKSTPTPSRPAKPKKDKKPKITFTGTDGVTYRLPDVDKSILALPTRAYRDAVRSKDQDAIIDLVFQVIDASPDQAMADQFYALPLGESTKLVNDWLAQVVDGANVPQS